MKSLGDGLSLLESVRDSTPFKGLMHYTNVTHGFLKLFYSVTMFTEKLVIHNAVSSGSRFGQKWHLNKLYLCCIIMYLHYQNNVESFERGLQNDQNHHYCQVLWFIMYMVFVLVYWCIVM